MRKNTKLMTFVCVGLIALTSCQGMHNKSKHGHGQSNTNKHTMKIEKPNRVSYTYEQIIKGTFTDIMPLYCPVREMDWTENWNPKVVYSNCGLVEKDCIFITSHGDKDVVWIVSDYDIEKGHVVMYYHIPDVLVTKLEIQLIPMKENKTKAILTYSKISLSELGNKVLKDFTKKEYDIMMDSWEKAMNHYLETGEMLIGLPNF